MLIINEYEEDKYEKNSIQNRDDMATNVDVVGCMEEGNQRGDIYFHLAVFGRSLNFQ